MKTITIKQELTFAIICFITALFLAGMVRANDIYRPKSITYWIVKSGDAFVSGRTEPNQITGSGSEFILVTTNYAEFAEQAALLGAIMYHDQ